MRKSLLILISLLFLSGCSLRQVYEPEINKMSVIEYDQEKMLLRRNLEVGNEHFTVERCTFEGTVEPISIKFEAKALNESFYGFIKLKVLDKKYKISFGTL